MMGYPTRAAAAVQRVGRLIGAVIAGQHWNARLRHHLLRCALRAHRCNGGRGRPHPDETGLHTSRGECGVLRKESIAGMDRVRLGAARRREYRVNRKIALRRGCGSDVNRLIRQAHVTSTAISV